MICARGLRGAESRSYGKRMATPLYTTEILRLASETIHWPRLDNPRFSVERRAALCGSSLLLDLETDSHGRIAAIGMRPQSCAMGQASATIFARHAKGKDAAAIRAAHETLQSWLGGKSDAPDWPDIDMLSAARDYPARHGAILLPYVAARAALEGER